MLTRIALFMAVNFAVLFVLNVVLGHAGRRVKRVAFDALDHYRGKRGQRGRKLPQGWRGVSRLEVEGASC